MHHDETNIKTVENGAVVVDAQLLRTLRLPLTSSLPKVGPNVMRLSKQHNIHWMIPVLFLMKLGFYINYHWVQHGYVPMPLRLLVQHFLHVILLTGCGLAEALIGW